MSNHITKALSSCSVARLLSVSVWGMSHIHSFSEHRPQVHEHTINSPTPMRLMTHWTSLKSSSTYWQTKDKGELSPTAENTSLLTFWPLEEKFFGNFLRNLNKQNKHLMLYEKYECMKVISTYTSEKFVISRFRVRVGVVCLKSTPYLQTSICQLNNWMVQRNPISQIPFWQSKKAFSRQCTVSETWMIQSCNRYVHKMVI